MIYVTNSGCGNILVITVGGGTAGLVVALRLTKNFKVLVIEAGSDPLAFNNIPALTADLLGYPELDWKYQTVPQTKSCLGLNEKVKNCAKLDYISC